MTEYIDDLIDDDESEVLSAILDYGSIELSKKQVREKKIVLLNFANFYSTETSKHNLFFLIVI